MANGTVGFRDFDLGCVITLGALLEAYSLDGDERQAYAVAVDGVHGPPEISNRVPVFMKTPEDSHQNMAKPSFTFFRTSWSPNFSRSPFWGFASRKPADGEQVINVQKSDGTTISGYAKYTHRWRPDPIDIPYDLKISARTQREFQLMLMHAMRIMKPPAFSLKVTDSDGDLRTYDSVDVSYQDTSDLRDVQDRSIEATLSFTVWAEIDTSDEWDASAVTSIPQFEFSSID